MAEDATVDNPGMTGRSSAEAACDDLLVERPFSSRYQTALQSKLLISQKRSFRNNYKEWIPVVR